ncbi:MAG: 8-amino-7-oxononanoate synthase, partial [Deltaproteobacteria bacterium]|nr:8-amino-7-oxononanoate synthase [Deltaproteobacteria bacterium]
MERAIHKTLTELERHGLKRSLTLIESPTGPRVRIKGKDVLCLSSNDYLGLANNSECREAA